MSAQRHKTILFTGREYWIMVGFALFHNSICIIWYHTLSFPSHRWETGTVWALLHEQYRKQWEDIGGSLAIETKKPVKKNSLWGKLSSRTRSQRHHMNLQSRKLKIKKERHGSSQNVWSICEACAVRCCTRESFSWGQKAHWSAIDSLCRQGMKKTGDNF